MIDLCYSPGVVTRATKAEAAQVIANRLQRLADCGDKYAPATWETVARGLNVSVRHFHDHAQARGFSRAKVFCDTGLVGGGIGINTAYTEREQAEAWVHELAHLLLAAWLPPQLSDNADAYSYDGDPGDVAHDIARRVEGIILEVKI